MARVFIFAAAAASLLQSTQAQCTAVDTSKTYDYIVIGSGAGGIPIADRLTEAGKTVLLVEKGPPSSGRWNGTMKPSWLQGTNLTRFDVPGLFNQIWADGNGVTCEDTGVMAGCVLGGGIAVNSALWWKPHPGDWDRNFPDGWKSTDMAKPTDKVFQRIPGTTVPSSDGKLYLQQGFDRVSKGLDAAGFKFFHKPNDHPSEKNFTYGHPEFFIEHAERQGPLRTYLETAAARTDTFTLWTNTNARRVVRTKGHITGVELECRSGSGKSGTVNVTPGTGRVIVSAGTMGSAKLLFRSGIGPNDQLNVVKSSSTDGATMISQDQWINLPVGYNLDDHVGTDIQISHPDIVFYDFYAAYNNPVAADRDAYLKTRTGILTQVAPNLGPIAWTQHTPSDGIVRHIQWQARIEGNTKTAMTITQYLGNGAISRGRLTVTPQLNTQVATAPYLRDAADKEAVIQGIDTMRAALDKVQGLTWIKPTAGQTTTAFVNSIPTIPASRNSNHWTGTNKIGTDDGRNGGTAVVDLDTKVYGTDNLFVVDASIFPGMTTGNPSAAIIIAAERAAERILALQAPAKSRMARDI
ncbi:FAD/NAD(P)-binding domain-containing protein [Bimuria novae-zelandiae CBS 107.79]|uniref:FAD/NAD(P)-binding domain-containing protein n=1 Tax=Bimuria novae-zelandiae CBS 107.79 TaxID=1447943 RepID=A0A6A5UKK6_9PLEO|nr:FAD/NAD(P)-binding domain-containing protein [Bimuria novae-zelandiae CBS 107.79]